MEETIERHLVWAEHEEHGEMGWELRGCGEVYGPFADAMGLAHDMLEHFELDTVEDEIEAHAAMYWIRFETGLPLPNGKNLDLESFSNEWTSLYGAACGEGGVRSIDAQERLDDDIEADLDVIVARGAEDVSDEHEEWVEEEILSQLSANFRNWFRLGYRKTEERYSKIGQYAACYLFDEVTEGFKDLMRHREFYEGDELLFTVDLEEGTFSLDIQEE